MSLENKPEISVIVPVYRVEAYLRQCVDSIRKQTFQQLEIILVDDGSPDACPALCDELAQEDARIRVIHRANGGLSAARNTGLDAAEGDYVAFVDSDDFLAPEMYETLYRELKQKNADVAVCSYQEVTEQGTPGIHEKAGEMQAGGMSGLEFVYAMASHGAGPYVVAMNKLYRKALFESNRYPEGKLHEDILIFVQLFSQCERVVICPQKLYFYRKRSESITTRKATIAHLANMEGYYRYFCFLKAHGKIELLAGAEKKVFGALVDIYCFALSPEERRSAPARRACEMQMECARILWDERQLSLMRGIRTFLFQKVNPVYRLLRRGQLWYMAQNDRQRWRKRYARRFGHYPGIQH